MQRRNDLSRPQEKPIAWRGSSLRDLRAFPREARREAGFQLDKLQHGQPPDDWKAMAPVGAGAIEVRIHVAGEYRVMVVTRFAEAIYVLHAFQKKSRRTTNHDIRVAKRRYQDLMEERQS